MNLQIVLERFSAMSNVELDDSSPWIPICKDSIEEIKRHLKKDVNIEDPLNIHRLETAATALSLYKYSLYSSTSNASMESFSAGEVRIKTDPNTAIKSAYKIWQQARSAINDLLIDESFVFERIV